MAKCALIPRTGLTRANYVRLGIPKQFVRQATVIDDQGRRFVDLARLSELSGRPFVQIANQFSRANFPKMKLVGVRERLREFGMIKGENIQWKFGLENSDERTKNEVILICRGLLERLAGEGNVWGLKKEDFEKELPEVGASLIGFFGYFARHPAREGKEVKDFMLEKLGYGRFADLTIPEQLIAIRGRGKGAADWGNIPLQTQRYLVEHLAGEKSVWGLTAGEFRKEQPELGTTLGGLLNYYTNLPERKGKPVFEFMLVKLGYDRFADLTIPEQLIAIRERGITCWGEVPPPTQRYLVERMAGEGSIWQLTQRDFKKERPEISSSLYGLYSYYLNLPERGEKETVEFMLEALGYGRFAALTVAEQLAVMRGMEQIIWEKIPLPTQRSLVELLVGEGNVWDLVITDFQKELPEAGSLLIRIYGYYATHPERGEKEIIKFMLEQLGFGTPAFNAAGRLYASARVDCPSESLYRQLTTTRAIVADWQERGPDRGITGLKLKYVNSILKEARYTGMGLVFQGSSVNSFNLSYLDLLCLAFQHVPLDSLDPAYRAAHPAEPNYLVPSMFSGYAHSSAESQKAGRVVGYYNTRQRDRELPLLIQVLEKRIMAVRRTALEMEEGFDPKWLETQRQGLAEIARRIESKEPLPQPLIYALGFQGRLDDLQPKLADASKVAGMRLNPAQSHAARIMLEESNPLVMVQGPAGSGKTYLTARVVEELVRSGKRVLYVAPTHKAADVFMERVDRSPRYVDVPVLRLGVSSDRFAETAKKYWVRDANAKDQFRKQRGKVQGSLFVGTIAGGIHFAADAGAKGTRESLFGEYLGERGIRISHDFSDYDVVMIDEASMASKPEVYAALAVAKRAIIIGDHVQLEPFPIDKEVVAELSLNEAQRESVERSLLEALMFDDYPHVLLDQNYRAINPVMIVLASRIFYDERIRVNQDSRYFTLPPEERRREYPADSLKLIDTSSMQYEAKQEARDGTSYVNVTEANLVVNEVKQFLAQGFKLEEIAIITPYKAQVDLIRQMLRAEGVPEEILERWVSTFDGFQGDENKCVIISFVRSNEKKPPETGFVGNYHRVNVGITRAQERMVLIGDWSTLKKTGNDDKDVSQLSATDNLSLHTRHIFEELEAIVAEFEAEERARIVRLN